MMDRIGKRPLAVGGALVAIAAGAGIAVALSDGGDERSSATTGITATTERTAGTRPGQTTTPTAPKDGAGSNVLGREQEVQETVTLLVEASEQGDAETVCHLLGEPVLGRSGLRALQACAAAAGANLEVLPTSDELSIERVEVSGDRGRARLAGGTAVFLRRVDGTWRVRRITPPR
jgi:hypothetical protein